MKNFKKIFATVMGTICSVSFSNFANAWGHRGITDDQIRQLQTEFDNVWKTLKPVTDKTCDLPEDRIIEAARNGKINLNCAVRAKVLKDILIKWDVMATTGIDYEHTFIVLLRDNGKPLALDFYDDENDKPKISIEPLSNYLICQTKIIPVFNENIARFSNGLGFSLGVWLRLMKLQVEKERQDITKGYDVALKKLENGLKKYIKISEKIGNLFLQPTVRIQGDKYLFLPTEIDENTLFQLDSYLKDNFKYFEGYLENYQKNSKYDKLSISIDNYKIIKFKPFLDEETIKEKLDEEYLGYNCWFDTERLKNNGFVLEQFCFEKGGNVIEIK